MITLVVCWSTAVNDSLASYCWCLCVISMSVLHITPMALFKQINLLKVNDICKLNEIKFYYKLVHKQQPQYFKSFTHEANSDIHGHNTRSRDKLHFPKTKHDFAKINLRYRILQTINELPETVTSKVYTHSINGVTNYAKQYFISGYKKQCTIGNCYICQHTI